MVWVGRQSPGEWGGVWKRSSQKLNSFAYLAANVASNSAHIFFTLVSCFSHKMRYRVLCSNTVVVARSIDKVVGGSGPARPALSRLNDWIADVDV